MSDDESSSASCDESAEAVPPAPRRPRFAERMLMALRLAGEDAVIGALHGLAWTHCGVLMLHAGRLSASLGIRQNTLNRDLVQHGFRRVDTPYPALRFFPHPWRAVECRGLTRSLEGAEQAMAWRSPRKG